MNKQILTNKLKCWIALDANKLPDFIIGGAMKCGTTSLHTILNSHPNVFIPHEEIHFFNIDDILQHGDYTFYDKSRKTWTFQDMQKDPSRMWNWYLSKFDDCGPRLKGEDSTTYLASRIAAERIAIQPKPIKLIFMLRQPTQRAYSQYYHDLRDCRATHSFEETIRFNPQSLLSRGLYKEQLEFWYKVLPREQIKVVLFEDFIADKLNVLKDICQYLEINFDTFDEEIVHTHSNKGKIPKWIDLQIVYNQWFREIGNRNSFESLPFYPDRYSGKLPLGLRVLNKLNNVVNRKQDKPPRIDASTRAFLDRFYKREMFGIDELVMQPIFEKWFD